MINAGKYKHRIGIYSVTRTDDSAGFPVETSTLVLTAHASVKTTKGMTLIKNDSDFEKALTNFTIRYPHHTTITRDMVIHFNNKVYEIQYLNNVNEENVELEIQAKEITH